MKIKVEDLIHAVRTAIDEIGVNDAEFAQGQDSQEMDYLIESKLEESIDFVHAGAAIELLRMDALSSVTQEDEADWDNGVVTVNLDSTGHSGFLRLVQAFSAGWSYPVTEALIPSDPRFAIARNPYVGGTYERPAVLYFHTAGGKVLELRKIKVAEDGFTASFFERAKRVPYDVVSDADSYDIDANMEQAVLYYAAGLVMMTYNRKESENLFNQCLVQMGIAKGE